MNTNSNPTTETHWACACIKRDSKGQMKAIKLHPKTTMRCRICGAKQFARPATL